MSIETQTLPPARGQRKVKASGDGRSVVGRHPGSTILVTAILVIVALYFLIPVYWVVIAATKSTEELFTTGGFWFGHSFHLFTNLQMVLTYDGGIFVRWFLNSVFYAGVGAVFATYFAAAGGYALAKYEFRGRETIFGIILGGVLVPGTATALPLFLFFSQLGLANTYWSVLLPSLVSPFWAIPVPHLCKRYRRYVTDGGRPA